jgi:hypothetical protein
MDRSLAPPPRLVSNLVWRKHVSSTVMMASMAVIICCGLIMRIDRREFRTILASETHRSDLGKSLWQTLPPSLLSAAEMKFEQGFTDGEVLASKTQSITSEVGAQQLKLSVLGSTASPKYARRQNAVAQATAWSPVDSNNAQRELALARLLRKASPQAAEETHRDMKIEPRLQEEYALVPARFSVRSRSYTMPELSQLSSSEHADKNVQKEAEEAHQVKGTVLHTHKNIHTYIETVCRLIILLSSLCLSLCLSLPLTHSLTHPLLSFSPQPPTHPHTKCMIRKFG